MERKLTAILSADVEGYSRLMGEDEEATIRTLTSYRQAMETLIRMHRGRVVDCPGDNLLAEFGSVVDAVQCAVVIQTTLRAENANLAQRRRMEFRIGINLGDVLVEGERIYGDGVNIAARVEGLADGGGICITGTVFDQIKGKVSVNFEDLGPQQVKNIAEPIRAYRAVLGFGTATAGPQKKIEVPRRQPPSTARKRRRERSARTNINQIKIAAAKLKQEIRFCKTVDGVTIAYSTMGQGPPLVVPPQWVSHLEADLIEGPFGDVYEALRQHHMLVRFDKRGTGLSERNVSELSDDLFVIDLEAVVDELKLQRFALYGLSAGGRLILDYYAKHPDRVSHLVFYGTSAAQPVKELSKGATINLSVIRASWEVGSKLRAERMVPDGGTREDIERLACWIRLAVTSDVAQRLIELALSRKDQRPLLSNVSVPTLVIHRRGDHVPFAGGQELASKIPGAQFIPLEGNNHLPSTHGEGLELATPVIEFLAQDREHLPAKFADIGAPVTLLFTDIEASTVLTQRLDDEGVQRFLQDHNDMVGRALRSYAGTEVKHTGDGIMGSFISASRAVGCALHIQRNVANRNVANPEDAVKLRIGLNAGEPIVEGDILSGTLVQLARGICDWAEPGQVLVSDVVRQLVAGKGFEFKPVGEQLLKGFDEPVALYKVPVR